jgi:hypothetical protein
MHKACAERVERLWKTLGKTLDLYNSSTGSYLKLFNTVVFYPAKATASAQDPASFTQALESFFYPLRHYLYPVSTQPTNATNLIKE